MKTHPYAEASYEVIALAAGGFGVRVSNPDSNPTTVSSFASESAALAWISAHKERVQNQSRPGTIFRRPRPPMSSR